MTLPDWLAVAPEVAAALAAGRPVVALESTLVSHGLPWPANRETARAAEAAVRAGGAVPATVAVLAGRPSVGLTDDDLTLLAQARGVMKAGRRDLGAAVGLGRTAGTTVSATMALAHAAGVRVFATGGIGGAHRREIEGGRRKGEGGDEGPALPLPLSAFPPGTSRPTCRNWPGPRCWSCARGPRASSTCRRRPSCWKPWASP